MVTRVSSKARHPTSQQPQTMRKVRTSPKLWRSQSPSHQSTAVVMTAPKNRSRMARDETNLAVLGWGSDIVGLGELAGPPFSGLAAKRGHDLIGDRAHQIVQVHVGRPDLGLAVAPHGLAVQG